MDVSRTIAAIGLWRESRHPVGKVELRWRRFVLTACCGASLGLVGCQSAGWLSRSGDKSNESVKAELDALLNRNREHAAADSSSAAAPAGSAVVARQLQMGDQALAEHGQNPARLSDARKHFEEVLRADPNNATAHHRLGVIADLTNNFPEAERHYAQALQRNPSDPQLLHDIGYSCLLQDKPDQAVKYLERACELSPGFDMASRKLADAYVRTNQPELARQTLARLMPADQAGEELQRLQAAHDPAAKPSLFGRVRQNMRDLRPEDAPPDDSATQELLVQLEQARRERDRERQQSQQQPFAQQPAVAQNPLAAAGGWPQPALTVHDSQLSQAMAALERQSHPAVGQPVYIDANARTPGYGPGPMAGAQVPQMVAQAAPVMSGPVAGQPSVGEQGFQYAEVIRGTQRGTASPQEAYLARQQAANPGWSRPVQAPITPQDPTIRMTAGRYTPGSLGDYQPQFADGGVQSAEYTAGTDGTLQPSPGLRPSMLAPSPNTVPGGTTGVPVAGQVLSAPEDDYQAAAALGMGIGPGQMFPVIRRAEVVSAGTNSMWNGAQYPQPGRQLPTDRQIPDLSQAFQQPGGPSSALATGPNSLGQQNPALGQYYTTPGQFGGNPQTPAPGAAEGQQPQWTNSSYQEPTAAPGGNFGLQGYEQLRSQYDAQMNAQIQQVQGQYPSSMMSSPSAGLPMERPEQAAAMMNGWYSPPGLMQPGSANQPANVRHVVTPQAYGAGAGPQSGRGAITPLVQPQMNVPAGTPQLPTPQYGANVVVPPDYATSRGMLLPAAGGASNPGAGGYQGPLIVPGR
jgi:Flp pilus assembly protein TadD